jgi:hypothetical protein
MAYRQYKHLTHYAENNPTLPFTPSGGITIDLIAGGGLGYGNKYSYSNSYNRWTTAHVVVSVIIRWRETTDG